MKQDYSKVKVGDKVWWGDISSRGRGLSEGVVTKVGSKLITAVWAGRDGQLSSISTVFRKDTGRTNDGYGHQTLIVDLEAHQEECRRSRAYSSLRYGIGPLPEDVAYADIVEAAKLLRIKIE